MRWSPNWGLSGRLDRLQPTRAFPSGARSLGHRRLPCAQAAHLCAHALFFFAPRFPNVNFLPAAGHLTFQCRNKIKREQKKKDETGYIQKETLFAVRRAPSVFVSHGLCCSPPLPARPAARLTFM